MFNFSNFFFFAYLFDFTKLGLEDGDEIDAMLDQEGGGFAYWVINMLHFPMLC